MLLAVVFLITNITHTMENHMTKATPIGQQYINLISQFEKGVAQKLFVSNAKKIVNSKVICNNRDQLLSQMQDIKETFGITKINLLELITGIDPRINVIRFEITYGDNTTESVISIIKCDDSGLIEEINEVFGEKEIYQWQS